MRCECMKVNAFCISYWKATLSCPCRCWSKNLRKLVATAFVLRERGATAWFRRKLTQPSLEEVAGLTALFTSLTIERYAERFADDMAALTNGWPTRFGR